MINVNKPLSNEAYPPCKSYKTKSGHSRCISWKYNLLYGLILLGLAGFPAAKFVFAQGTLITGGLSRIRVADTLVSVEGGFITEVVGNKLYIRALSLSPRIILESDPIDSKVSAADGASSESSALSLAGDEIQSISSDKAFDINIYNINPQRIVLEGESKLQRDDDKVSIKTTLAPCEKKVLQLQTIFPDKDSFSFAVMGDSLGRNNTFKNILKKLNKSEPLFAANLGDLVNDGKRKEYRRVRRQIGLFKYPLFFALGNHDVLWWGRMVYQEYFGPTYYSFDFRDAHFIFLDNASGRIDDRQFRWLEEDLQQNTKTRTFVFMHLPPFDPRPDKYHAMNRRLNAQYFMHLASKYRVDRVFCSHIHEYLREERDGVVYIITGGAGAELRNPDAYYHYVQITVGPEGITEEIIKP